MYPQILKLINEIVIFCVVSIKYKKDLIKFFMLFTKVFVNGSKFLK